MRQEFRRIGGDTAVEALDMASARIRNSLGLSVAERRRRRMGQEGFWFLPTKNTLDRATAMMPRLLYERLDDLGLDFCVIYPTAGLGYYRLPSEKHRRALCRAYNTFTAEQFRPYGDTEYDAWLVRIHEGEQFGSGFVAVNPNSKIPALLDRSGAAPIRVFESGAILLYLAEKFGAFLPTERSARAECLSWLFWQMGSAPYLGGGFGHFYAYAPTKIEYAIDRFAMEVKRQLDVLDRRLAESEFLQVQEYKHVQRWTDQIAARAAVKRGRMVNRTWGEPSSQLHERHEASDFDTRTQDKLTTAG